MKRNGVVVKLLFLISVYEVPLLKYYLFNKIPLMFNLSEYI